MEEILFTGKSATHAQMMKKVLENNGFSAKIVRPDISITQGNCAFAVRISETYFAEAAETLRSNRVMPVRAFVLYGNKYREIGL